jgi:hypothetical protein
MDKKQDDLSETISDRLTTTKTSANVSRKHKQQFTNYSGSRKSSQDTTGMGKGFVKFENNYRLLPKEDQRFVAYKIQPKLHEIITEKLKQTESNGVAVYNHREASRLSRELADAIKREAKNHSIPRYKLVSHVLVGQNLGQDTRVASRCLWNTEFDNSITFTVTNKSFFVTTSLYALYCE